MSVSVTVSMWAGVRRPTVGAMLRAVYFSKRLLINDTGNPSHQDKYALM